MQEIWLPISGYESFYEISNLGRVRSLSRMVANRWGRGNGRPVPGQIKVPSSNAQGYLSVHLYALGKMGKRYIHRLVATAFIPNTGDLPQVNHLDGDKSNNRETNLAWCTGSENCQHAISEKLYVQVKGEKSSSAKITESDVLEIRRRAMNGEMQKDIAPDFGIGRKAISKIVNHQRWRHVT